jgi:hypothetical protein
MSPSCHLDPAVIGYISGKLEGYTQEVADACRSRQQELELYVVSRGYQEMLPAQRTLHLEYCVMKKKSRNGDSSYFNSYR